MWEPLKKRELSDDVVLNTEASLLEVVGFLQSFNSGELWEKDFYVDGSDITKLSGYISLLKDNGLDIGKGNATFGYKMPLSDRKGYRILQIFKR